MGNIRKRNDKRRTPLVIIRALILGCLLAFAGGEAYSLPAPQITVATLPNAPEISSGEMGSTLHDSAGYIWYGAQGTICRDDGYEIITFPVPGADYINDITEDQHHRLWIASDDGVFTLDPDTYEVKPFEAGKYSHRDVSQVKVTSDGSVWITARGTLQRYSLKGKLLKEYLLTDRSGNPTDMSGFLEASNGDILMTSYSRGIYRYDRRHDRFTMYAPIEKNVSLGLIVEDKSKGYFWVSDHDGMIYCFNPSAPEGQKFRESLLPDNPYVNNRRRVREMIQDPMHGYLWILARTGIVAMKPDSDNYLQYVEIPQLRDYRGALVTSAVADGDKIWVYCMDAPSIVIQLDNSTTDNNYLQGVKSHTGDTPAITHLVADPGSDRMWMIQHRSGVMVYSPTTGTVAAQDLPHLHGRRLYEANKLAKSAYLDGVWTSTRRNQNIIGLVSDTPEDIRQKDALTISGDVSRDAKITSLFEDRNGRLFVGTSRGLLKYDLRDKHLELRYPSIEDASSVQRVGNSLWVTANGKLYQLTDGHTPLRILVNREITSIADARNGKLWLGSKDGHLLYYDIASRGVKDYTNVFQDGFKRIIDLYVDKYSHLWIVTNSKVAQFNFRDKTYVEYPANVPGNLSAYLTPQMLVAGDDLLVVGGIGGLAMFTTSNRLDIDIKEPTTVLTNVKVRDKSMLGDRKVYKSSNEIVLPAKSTNVEFCFSTLDHANASGERFAYRIRGLDKGWNYTKRGSNRAFYNLIPGGEWVMEVKACDENNHWSSKVTEIHIDQKMPWYASWWTWILYALVLIAVIIAIGRFYTERLKNKNEEMWNDSEEMVKMREYLQSPVSLPEEEFRQLDKILLEKATKVVEANISVPDFKVTDLAREVNMSKSTLARKLKAITGMTPLDFIRQIKMRYACHLLESQNYTVGEVAEITGFDDRRYFTSCFKKEIGVTPSAYARGERAPEA